ncbi:hypothetical protein JCM11641_004552 [Rhodosporidiobolus odoratus]
MPPPPAQDDGFTSVSYKKPPRARKGKNSGPPRERTIEEKLESRASALKDSGYLTRCRELVREALAPRSAGTSSPGSTAEPAKSGSKSCPRPQRVVCLGLGSLADSLKAQEQYLLLKELLDELQETIDPHVKTEFYDPAFIPEDSAFLTSQGFSVLPAEHPLRLTRPTLLYIPHGPRTLFEALLRANWTSSEQLQRVIILGNRLDLYDDPTYSGSSSQSGRKARQEGGGGDELGHSAEYIVKAAKLFSIVPLPDTKEHMQAFNDLALEWAVPERCKAEETGSWRAEEVDAKSKLEKKQIAVPEDDEKE